MSKRDKETLLAELSLLDTEKKVARMAINNRIKHTDKCRNTVLKNLRIKKKLSMSFLFWP